MTARISPVCIRWAHLPVSKALCHSGRLKSTGGFYLALERRKWMARSRKQCACRAKSA
jgi:hypothetical protein